MIMSVSLRLLYLILVQLNGWLALLDRSSASMDAELVGVPCQNPRTRLRAPPIGRFGTAQGPAQITRNGSAPVRLQFQITECTAARNRNGIALTLRFHRFWDAFSRTIRQDQLSDVPENPVDTASQ